MKYSIASSAARRQVKVLGCQRHEHSLDGLGQQGLRRRLWLRKLRASHVRRERERFREMKMEMRMRVRLSFAWLYALKLRVSP